MPMIEIFGPTGCMPGSVQMRTWCLAPSNQYTNDFMGSSSWSPMHNFAPLVSDGARRRHRGVVSALIQIVGKEQPQNLCQTRPPPLGIRPLDWATAGPAKCKCNLHNQFKKGRRGPELCPGQRVWLSTIDLPWVHWPIQSSIF